MSFLFALITKIPYKILGGLYLGWGIGANDSANVFGTAVATNSIKFKTAVTLISIFAILGAFFDGPKIIDQMQFAKFEIKQDDGTVRKLDFAESLNMALISTFSAAVTVTVLTYFGLPISTSQAAVGGIMGVSVYLAGLSAIDWSKFSKMLVCWVLTPIGAIIFTLILYKVVSFIINKRTTNQVILNRIYKTLLIVAGCYGAYALGGNNVSITTASYYQAGLFGFGPWSKQIAVLLGGISIAVGALTYSKNVMVTIGEKISVLDPYSALISIFAHSITLQIFTLLHVPVSSSQAMVGAVIGIGLLKGVKAIQFKTLFYIFLGWLITPLASGIAAYLMVLVF